jgi:anti-anti-sigma factor
MRDRSIVSLRVQPSDDGLVLCVRGDLDLAGRHEIQPWVIVAVAVAPRVTLDLADVAFCSSEGLAMLVECAQRARAERSTLTIVNPSARIEQLLANTGLEHLLTGSTDRRAPSCPPAPPSGD